MNDLARAYGRQRQDIDEAVATVLRSGWFVHGPQHEAFERELGELLGVPCLGVASGTDALELAVRAVTEDRDGPVLTAANAGGYASTAIYRCGRMPTFADVDPATLCLEPQGVAAALTPDIAAVVVTHLYGRMARVEDIADVCSAYGVPVVEDCAQAIGASREHAAGAVGDVAAFSFYPTKNLGALGDGGAVASRRPDIVDRVQRLRQYGWSTKYRVEERGGVNSRLDELQAAVLRVRLSDVEDGNGRRRSIISRYADAARGGSVRVLPADGGDHAGHLAVAVVEEGSRERVRGHLDSRAIATDVHYPVPDHRQPAWVLDHRDVVLPATEAAARSVLSLPCFPELTDEEVEQVCQALQSLS